VHPKNIARVFNVLRNLLRPIPNLATCLSSPGLPENLYPLSSHSIIKKKGAVMQMAIVSHGKTKTYKIARREELPFVCSFFIVVTVIVAVRRDGAMPLAMEN
jgi:hypothetical protein